MAAPETTAAAQSTKEAKPLAFMHNLNSMVAYFDPGPSAPPPSDAPRLIIVLGWMDARDAHVAKYIDHYRTMFPSSRILLVRSPGFMWARHALRRENLQAAVPVLRDLSTAAADTDEQPQVLLHVFSNGGVASAGTLWELWAGSLDGAGQRMPRFVTVMDSCPGFWNYAGNLNATALSLPGWAWPVAHGIIFVCWLLWLAHDKQGPQEANAAILNSPAFMSREVRRTYVYGTADRAVAWEHIETHAREAQQKGSTARLEKFEGGQHVSQMRVDADRYWRAVGETWTGN
ncbi:hypothetical protein B0T10DRAFT_190514 [Thelonectria olida]|uniref:Indole-diterpene biosynthesis protein PaxU n=1 Tax=Thelonectria olida TaxID=1576542 RepID=A0A9P8VUN7_9HYPO|nr:hypothetical protein B0T10DRAFT_190514 [Thelonectria olida]